MNAIMLNLVLVALLGGAVAGLIGGVAVLQRRRNVHPEIARKLVHIGAGLIALSIPWLFSEVWPVILLTVLASAAMVLLKSVRALRDGVGQATGAVLRKTLGEVLFPVAAGLLFVWSAGDKLLYSIPLLILTFADTLAALVGEQYGKLRLKMSGDRKSYEGVLAFFLTAFFCVHVPVLMWGHTTRLASLLIGVDVSLLVMMAEAATSWGLDNLIIPIWGYMLLKSLLEMDAAQLAVHLTFVLSLGLLMRFWHRQSALGDDALFGATLWGYVVWAVSGWRWRAASAHPPAGHVRRCDRKDGQSPPARIPIPRRTRAGCRRLLLAARLSRDRGRSFVLSVRRVLRRKSRHHRAGQPQVRRPRCCLA